MEIKLLFLKEITPIAKLSRWRYTYQNIPGEDYVAWRPWNGSLKRSKII
jgi:hypothetical protein